MVPDTSVVVAGLFEEPLTRPAKRLLDAIAYDRVRAFAPFSLVTELVKTASEKVSRRSGASRLDPEAVERQIEQFLELPIVYVRETDLAMEAWRLIAEERVSPPDAWMLACAMRVGGELWASHDHADGFVAASRALHPAVFTLADDPARLP